MKNLGDSHGVEVISYHDFWKCRLFPGLSAKFVIHGLRWGLFKTSASTFALSSASSYSGAHDR